MTVYIGIDLGTSNSAVCSYNGEDVTLYKSPEQTDVTPSVIYVGKRGNRYYGSRAYELAPRDPGNVAKDFKRMMGTSTPVQLPAVGLTMSPVECSAEILKVLFGYLPEELRNDPEIGTVITVPAAFNQMQKDATLQAAEAAGIGKVALMQEPVAAVMSVMRKRRGDGIFLIYDIGGGTLDIAIAQSIGGRVSLLGQGGIAMCGGRDFDRVLVDNIAMPWLLDNFDLPDDFTSREEFKTVRRMVEFAAERAKIQLSSRDDAMIEAEDLGAKDASGEDMYIACPLTRAELDELIADKIADSITAAREAIQKAGLTPQDIERIVFVGGPSQYKPLRDKVAFEVGLAASTDVNPMTAVAEGAAVFAESINWSATTRSRKSNRGKIAAGALNLVFNYVARTPDVRAKLAIATSNTVKGSTFQVDSIDTGWSSGKVELHNGAAVDLPLSKAGDNTFRIFVFDAAGGPIKLETDRIVIARTAAVVDAIPASHSLGLEVRSRVGGNTELEYLVRQGDPLPKKGQIHLKAGESIRAGAGDALNFKLYEGDIAYPVSDNSYVGLFTISGSDFTDGIIAAGADVICEYEVSDSGNIALDVTIPSIGGSFRSNHNFYSRREAERDFTQEARRIHDDAARVKKQLSEISDKIDDPSLDEAHDKLSRASAISPTETSPEATKQAMDDVQRAKELLAKARKDNSRVIRRIELDGVKEAFEDLRKLAKSAEAETFDLLARTAERDLEKPGPDFDMHLKAMRGKIFGILVRQDWFMVDRFNWYADSPHLFGDARLHQKLLADGKAAISRNDMLALRETVWNMDQNRISQPDAEEFLARANVMRA